MNSGPSSSQPTGFSAEGSGIVGGASSSQSSGFLAPGSGILKEGGERERKTEGWMESEGVRERLRQDRQMGALLSIVPVLRLAVLRVTDLPRGHDGRGQVLQQVALVERQLVHYDVVLSRRVDHWDVGVAMGRGGGGALALNTCKSIHSLYSIAKSTSTVSASASAVWSSAKGNLCWHLHYVHTLSKQGHVILASGCPVTYRHTRA